MTIPVESAFRLSEQARAKADASLIAEDERHFATIKATLASTIADLTSRLDQTLKADAGRGRDEAGLTRDTEVHRLSARLRTIRRFGLDLCLGRMVPADGAEPIYIGRLGLTDRDGMRLLIDWRSPAAEPFFGATLADPMGLASRRRFRWADDHVTDYWDEVLSPEAVAGPLALDDDSAFITGLGAERTTQMRDVLGTIQADQIAIIRAGSRGALVVDGGPGTGKTVVALHRAAYLLHADPRLGERSGGVLFIGPHQPYLDYVADVLPSLGEDGVRTCTISDLVSEVARAEEDSKTAALKESAQMVAAIEPAVALYEEPPTTGLSVSTPWSEVWVSARDWAEAFGAVDPGTPHNEARDQVWDELITILLDRHDADELPIELVERDLRSNEELREMLHRAWPLVEHTDLVADLWSVPAYLRRCAPWLNADQIAALQRDQPYAWTDGDLPLLDAAKARLGDPEFAARERRRRATLTAQRAEMDRVVDALIEAETLDDGEGLARSLRQSGLRDALVDESAAEAADPDLLAGPFAHVMVDEAQELTDAQWQMVLRRCPSRSLTIVGDRAQSRRGFTESWVARLARVGAGDVRLATLSVNYRTPTEVMIEAEPVIRAAIPDANVPTSIRSSGIAVHRGALNDLDDVVARWRAAHPEGTACVIGSPEFRGTERVESLTPTLAKGLEFDLVILVDPDSFGLGIEGAVDRYVSMTRATRELVILTSSTQKDAQR